ncbi:hypothetical protein DYH09_13415 [bacterium CPR1]|nr:hypothetical protein [bacterium CPR1]
MLAFDKPGSFALRRSRAPGRGLAYQDRLADLDRPLVCGASRPATAMRGSGTSIKDCGSIFTASLVVIRLRPGKVDQS